MTLFLGQIAAIAAAAGLRTWLRRRRVKQAAELAEHMQFLRDIRGA